MCGRFTLSLDGEKLRNRFDLADTLDLEPRYNIAPTQSVAVVRLEAGLRRLPSLRWGLVPSWAEAADGPPLINARAETVRRKPSFKESLERRRCIVPADGYYEWKKVPGYKQPYHIRLKGRRMFGMAGLWDSWKGSSGSIIESFAIITTESNTISSTVHNRMPVILPEDSWSDWLNTEVLDSTVDSLMAPFPSDMMEMEQVSPVVNRVATDSPDCLRPAEVNFELDL
jgi:putative SOS response-associated peptidase YedK